MGRRKHKKNSIGKSTQKKKAMTSDLDDIKAGTLPIIMMWNMQSTEWLQKWILTQDEIGPKGQCTRSVSCIYVTESKNMILKLIHSRAKENKIYLQKIILFKKSKALRVEKDKAERTVMPYCWNNKARWRHVRKSRIQTKVCKPTKAGVDQYLSQGLEDEIKGSFD